ncbi:MAG TPA: TolC family protein [Gemmatimonadales bacterium]|nr:TolC family protein [Gemmatimonadales bacterium]
MAIVFVLLLSLTAQAAPGASSARLDQWPAEAGASATQAPPPALTLPDALGRARAQSPRRRAALALSEGARAAAEASAPWVNPSIEVRGENWRVGDRTSDPPVDAFAVVTQPLEIGGKRGARRALAVAGASLAATDLDQVDRWLTLEVARRYTAVLRARGMVALLVEQAAGTDEIVRVMRRRVEEGYAAEGDLRKFEAETARLRAELLRAELDLARTVAGLGAVLGSAEPVDAAGLAAPDVAPPPLAAAAVSAEKLARRPDVAAADARVERASRQLALERALRIPDLAVSGGYKRTAGVDTGVVAVAMPIPIGDRNRAAILRAEAEARAASLEREGVLLDARAEALSALGAAAALRERAALADDELLAPAAIVRTAARAAFREGGGDVLRLVDAERGYTEARRTTLDLRLDAAMAAIEARLALGEQVTP